MNPAGSAWLNRQAHALRRSVQRGELDAETAGYLISELQDQHLKSSGTNRESASPAVAARSRSAARIVDDLDYMPLSELIDEYLKDRSKTVIASTVEGKRRALKAFSEWLPADPEIGEITRRTCGLYVSERLASNGKSPKTNTDTVGTLGAFWQWAIRKGRYDHANPRSGLGEDLKGSRRGTANARTRRPWTVDEIAKLQTMPQDDAMYPLCMIALHSGMRLNEIAHLKLSDVDLKAGMFCISEGKTAAAVRQVPIHPKLTKLVKKWREKSTDDYLIAGLKPGGVDQKRGHNVSKRIGRWIRENVTTDPGVVFHSLRNTFMHQCEIAGILESTTQLLVGHSRQSLTYGLYSPGVNFELLRKAVGKLSY